MAGSVNKVIIIGRLGQDPDVRSMQSGDRVANLSLATSETWKDKNTGERQERTQWHRVVIFNKGLVDVVDRYLKKGALVHVEGQLETRKYQKDGADHYVTEIVLRPFRGELNMLSSGGGESAGDRAKSEGFAQAKDAVANTQTYTSEYDDEIPF